MYTVVMTIMFCVRNPTNNCPPPLPKTETSPLSQAQPNALGKQQIPPCYCKIAPCKSLVSFFRTDSKWQAIMKTQILFWINVNVCATWISHCKFAFIAELPDWEWAEVRTLTLFMLLAHSVLWIEVFLQQVKWLFIQIFL
jgi:hypothetical protein